MFSFAAGEPLAISQHKFVLRREAQKRWPFLTPLDLSMIGNEQQLTPMAKDRIGGQQARGGHNRVSLVAHHRFRGSPSQSAASLLAWENEGGARQRSGHRISGTIGIRP